MASEQQIAANRRNAQKSTGPRSRTGKKTASANSYRHGLSVGVESIAEFTEHIDALAREISGTDPKAALLVFARAAAAAELDLGRVRRAKLALISRISAVGELDPFDPFSSWRCIKEILLTRYGHRRQKEWLGWNFDIPEPPELPVKEPERTAEAMRRALPELIKLDRYERGAAQRRERACREIMECIGRTTPANRLANEVPGAHT
jgi:hypothetical protein